MVSVLLAFALALGAGVTGCDLVADPDADGSAAQENDSGAGTGEESSPEDAQGSKDEAADAASGDGLLELQTAIEEAAAELQDSVVNVTIRQAVVDPFTGATQERDVGNGSGVILTEDGYILTNNHVIAGSDDILVSIGREQLPATIVGRDPSTDLAVIKVDAEGLSVPEFGSADDLRVGQWVVAAGSPFGLDKTVTVGIVSALNRSTLNVSRQDVTAYTNLIQTDAAINPGNSGGALATIRGEVIGINTLIQSPSGQVGAPQSAGIGFAIPIGFARDVAEQLIEDGSVAHPYIGVGIASVSAQQREQMDLPAGGAYVGDVEPGSPADEAGVRQGDVIVAVGERDVETFGDVFTAIRGQRIGSTVPITVMRDGEEVTLDVTIGSDERG